MLVSEEGIVSFDIDEAIAANEPAYIIEIGKGINQFSAGMQNDPESEMNKIRSGIPIYGSYCGPLHSGPGAPFDMLDEACMEHDNCYTDRGYFACSCDQELLNRIAGIWPFLDAFQQQFATIIFNYFAHAPCSWWL